MNGENNGKPYFSMDDLGVPFVFGNTHLQTTYTGSLWLQPNIHTIYLY